MTVEISASLITAGTACLVAVVTAIASRRNTAAVESLKSQLAARDASRALLEAEFIASCQHLDKLISSIQMFKDEMLLGRDVIESRSADRLGSIPDTIRESAKLLATAYADAVSHLSKDEQHIAHEAKLISFKVQQLTKSFNTNGIASDTNDSSVLQNWDSLRLELTNLQMTLRDARMRRFIGNVVLRRL